MIKLDKCPLCDNKNISLFLESKDYSTSKELFNIEKCNACSFLFTNPRPEEEKIGNYYISDNYLSHTNKKEGLFSAIYQIVRKIAIRSKTKLLVRTIKPISHLDIGCGTGEFLKSCKDKGINVIGIEPSESARKMAIKNYGLDIKENTGLNQFNNNTFVVDAGNLFFSKDTLEPGTPSEVAFVNADIILNSFNKMGCTAFSPGSKDFAAGKDFILEKKKEANFPFISSNIYDEESGQLLFTPYVIE